MTSINKAGAVIIRLHPTEKPDVLLLCRRAQQDWSFPKGHQEPGETIEACMFREVQEETGLSVRLLRPLPALDYIHPNGSQIKVHMYLVTPQDPMQHEQKEHEEDALAWIPFSQVETKLSYQNLKDYFRLLQPEIASLREEV